MLKPQCHILDIWNPIRMGKPSKLVLLPLLSPDFLPCKMGIVTHFGITVDNTKGTQPPGVPGLLVGTTHHLL